MDRPAFSRSCAFMAALFAGLCALILLLNWPWPRYFASGFVHHWDPPFHAWKLNLVARSILAGHLLPEGGNANVFYPNSLTLYFEALHWPEALVGAGLLLLTDNIVLVYHILLLGFWALSGCCFYLLVRELGFRRSTSLWGAAVFCVLPYRMSYVREFNMQLCFGLVLFLFFFLRYVKRPGFRPAVGMAVSFWLQASSELYQALILLAVSPFLFGPLLVKRLPEMVRSPRFYASAVACAALAVGLSIPILGPYRTLHDKAGFSRTLGEMQAHAVEPLSYLVPRHHGLWPVKVRVKRDEMSVYPTLAVAGLACAYAVRNRRVLRPRRREPGGGRRADLGSGGLAALGWARIAAAVAFVATIVALEQTGATAEAARRLSWIPNSELAIIFIATLLLSLARPRARSDSQLFVAGLGCAALLAFVLSMGPHVNLANTGWTQDNALFAWLSHWAPFLSGMRAISRFSLMVLIFLVVAAAAGWESLVPRGRWGALALAPVLGLICIESAFPHPKFVHYRHPWNMSILGDLDRAGPYTLAVLPLGLRDVDSQYMLEIGRADRTLVCGWGGFYPRFARSLLQAQDTNKPDRLVELLSQVWPETYILVDRKHPGVKHNHNAGLSARASEKAIAPLCTRLAEDDRFALYRIKPPGPVVRSDRVIRTDMLRKRPVIEFTARAAEDGPARVPLCVALNGTPVARVELGKQSRTFRIRWPESMIVDVYPNGATLGGLAGERWVLEGLTFLSPADAAAKPADRSVVEAVPRIDPSPAWLDHTAAMPSNATPAAVTFRNGARLEGVALGRRSCRPGEAIAVDWYWSCSADTVADLHMAAFAHFRQGAATRFQGDYALFTEIYPPSVKCQPYRKLFVVRRTIRVPQNCPPGRYTLHTGLEDLTVEKRVSGRSACPSRRGAFKLPVELEVEATSPRSP